MRDESLIEPFAAQEIYCDGFTDFRVRNGNMSCVGFRLQDSDGADPPKMIVVRLIFPKDSLAGAIEEAQKAATARGATEPLLWLRKAH